MLFNKQESLAYSASTTHRMPRKVIIHGLLALRQLLHGLERGKALSTMSLI